MHRRAFVSGLLGAAVASQTAPASALAQASAAAALSGPDRTRKLIDGAKREGFLNLYTSAVAEHMNAVATAFEKTYGVKVRIWRGGSEEILQRSVTEARGGRFDMDVAETAAMQIIAIGREKLLLPITTPAAADLMPQAMLSGEPWLPSRIVVFTGAYNTKVVPPGAKPRSYEDLRDPKWKGKLAIEADDNNWLMALCTALGEQKGMKLFGDIVAANGMSVRKGHTLMANLVASGEAPIALTVYYHEVEPLKKSGAPIDELNMAPAFCFAAGAGLANHAPHPFAGMLFIDFLLSQGQAILAAHDNVPANVKYQRLPANLRLDFMDVRKYMTESAKWTRLYKEILSRQRR